LAGGDLVAGVASRGEYEEDAYKLPKILSNSLSERSSEGAGEGDGGEAGGSESRVAGSSGCAANLSVTEKVRV
jgi:hypothetical protein